MVTGASDPPALSGGSHDPLLRFDHLREGLTEHKKHFTSSCWLITKDISKDRNEQPAEEIHKARSRRVLRAGDCPPGVGMCHPSGTWICSLGLKLSESHT